MTQTIFFLLHCKPKNDSCCKFSVQNWEIRLVAMHLKCLYPWALRIYQSRARVGQLPVSWTPKLVANSIE